MTGWLASHELSQDKGTRAGENWVLRFKQNGSTEELMMLNKYNT